MEIKFRQAIINEDGHFVVWHYWGYLWSRFGNMEITSPRVGFEHSDPHKGWVIKPSQQYIGLHDRNAQEIYEGDIVEYELGGKGVVFWHDQRAMFAIDRSYEDAGMQIDSYPFDDWDDWHVISHIYEEAK